MGYKNVCLNCKRIENLGTDRTQFSTGNCPECSRKMYFVNHKFRPPKKTDKKSWELVSFLISNGFVFQRVGAPYPKNLKEAKEFVVKYKDKAIKSSE